MYKVSDVVRVTIATKRKYFSWTYLVNSYNHNAHIVHSVGVRCIILFTLIPIRDSLLQASITYFIGLIRRI